MTFDLSRGLGAIEFAETQEGSSSVMVEVVDGGAGALVDGVWSAVEFPGFERNLIFFFLVSRWSFELAFVSDCCGGSGGRGGVWW